MKAFETSKNLEFAICDFGHRRPLSMKFEEFIETLTKHTDKSMPTNLFKEFYGLYVWAMMDPMVNKYLKFYIKIYRIECN